MDFKTDILIVGGGVGGCACALAACKAGLNVIMTEETDWIGGQFTSQATPPDEHGWIEKWGCTASYRKFREEVRQYYRDTYTPDHSEGKALTLEALNNPILNPGNGWVSPLCAEPMAFLAVLEATLKPFMEKNQLTVLTKHIPVAADSENGFVKMIEVKNLENNAPLSITAKYFVDATELGDVLPLIKTVIP